MDKIPPVLLLIAGLAIGALIGALVMWIRHLLLIRSAIEQASKRSVAQSRSTLKGQIAEQMAPLLPGFEYLPSDARFLGDPIDYVVFNGYTGVKDDQCEPESMELVIIDIKRGQAKLTPAQRAIASAVQAGRVRFEVIRIEEDGRIIANRARATR
jgi:predicted Holliday junction resolvase-like endonuclease